MVAGGVGIATGLGVFVIVDVGTALVLLGVGTVVVLALVVEPGCGGSGSHGWSTATPGTKGPSPERSTLVAMRRGSVTPRSYHGPQEAPGPKRGTWQRAGVEGGEMNGSESAGMVALVLGVMSLGLVGLALVPSMLPVRVLGERWRRRARLALAAGTGSSLVLLTTAALVLPPAEGVAGETSTTTIPTSSPATPTTAPGSMAPTAPSPTAIPTATTATGPDGPGNALRARVLSVVDGDTLVVVVGGVEERLRLIGIDAPERGECWSGEATAALGELVGDGEVLLTTDTSDRDQFGRLLRHVWLPDGTFVNEALVERGAAIARAYPPDTQWADRLSAAADRARTAGIGLWSPSACGASSDASVGFTAAIFDPPGDDMHPVTGERVTVTNHGNAAVDLTGWIIADEGPHRFPFPSGFVLGAGASVTIYSTCGQDAPDVLYWCNTRSAVWNNTGDTAFLWDPAGNVVDSTGPLGEP